MQELLTTDSLTNIHFPQRIKLIKDLRYVSFLINDIVLLGSLIILFLWFTNLLDLKDFLFQKLSILPSFSILFILSGLILLFGARRHILNAEEIKREIYPWWNTWIPVFLAIVISLLGLVNLFFNKDSFLVFHMSTIAGFCFFLIGLALIPPFTQIPHRFHISQFLVFIVSGLSMFVVLENIFALFTTNTIQHNIFFPFSLALTFALFCFGILLRWSNRGFFGNFTLDSTGSRFAFRIFLINLIVAPLTTLIILLYFQEKSFSAELLSIIVVSFTFISSLLMWVNVKLLYKYELEHLLMRESLRAHNIDLTQEEQILKQKMAGIEEERQQYKNALNIQSGWKNAIDNSE